MLNVWVINRQLAAFSIQHMLSRVISFVLSAPHVLPPFLLRQAAVDMVSSFNFLHLSVPVAATGQCSHSPASLCAAHHAAVCA